MNCPHCQTPLASNHQGAFCPMCGVQLPPHTAPVYYVAPYPYYPPVAVPLPPKPKLVLQGSGITILGACSIGIGVMLLIYSVYALFFNSFLSSLSFEKYPIVSFVVYTLYFVFQPATYEIIAAPFFIVAGILALRRSASIVFWVCALVSSVLPALAQTFALFVLNGFDQEYFPSIIASLAAYIPLIFTIAALVFIDHWRKQAKELQAGAAPGYYYNPPPV